MMGSMSSSYFQRLKYENCSYENITFSPKRQIRHQTNSEWERELQSSTIHTSHLNINTWTPCWSLSCCWDMKPLKIFTHAIINKPNIKTVDFIPCLSAAIHSWSIFYTQVCVCVCDSEQHRIRVCGFYVVFSNIKWFLL